MVEGGTRMRWNPDSRRRLFWICTSGIEFRKITYANASKAGPVTAYSHELGRSPVALQEVSCQNPFGCQDNSVSGIFAQMGGLLPLKEISSLPLEEILVSLERLHEKVHFIPHDQYFNKLIGADVWFCFFRFLCVTGQPITRSIRDKVTNIARIAVQTVKTLVRVGEPWWNMLHTHFQY